MTTLYIGSGTVVLLMLLLWAIHLLLRNAAIVDVGWAGGLALLAAIFAVEGGGWPDRKVLIGAMAVIWGLRLALHLLRTRVIGHPEEGRYVELRRKWKTNLNWKFLAFFEFQALLCLILSAPFYLAAANPIEGFNPIEIAGAFLWALAVAGESVADHVVPSLHHRTLIHLSVSRPWLSATWRLRQWLRLRNHQHPRPTQYPTLWGGL